MVSTCQASAIQNFSAQLALSRANAQGLWTKQFRVPGLARFQVLGFLVFLVLAMAKKKIRVDIVSDIA